jgi:hypothetical protein
LLWETVDEIVVVDVVSNVVLDWLSVLFPSLNCSSVLFWKIRLADEETGLVVEISKEVFIVVIDGVVVVVVVVESEVCSIDCLEFVEEDADVEDKIASGVVDDVGVEELDVELVEVLLSWTELVD